MAMFKQKFLRTPFLLFFLGVVFLPLYALFFTFPSFERLVEKDAERQAIRVADFMALRLRQNQPLSPPEADYFPEPLRVELEGIARTFGVMKFRLFDPGGRILLSTVPDETGTVNRHAYFQEHVAKGRVWSKTVSKDESSLEGVRQKRDVAEIYVPILDGERFSGAFEIYMDITAAKSALTDTLWKSNQAIGLLVAAFLLALWLVRQSVTRAMGRMSEAMHRIAGGNLEHRVPEIGQDELTEVASLFNRMANQLQDTYRNLMDERDKLNIIIQGALEGIVVTDRQGGVALVNPAAERLLGKTRERIADEGFFTLIDDPEYMREFLQRRGEKMPRTLVYNERVLNFYAFTIHDTEGQEIGSAALLRDVTEEKQLEEKLRRLSYTDALTGLLNRRRLDEVILEEFNRARRYRLDFGVLLFDVDHFKKFNDTYGHDQGDRVLVAIAQTAQGFFRTVDYCARYGGEEFCVIMPNTVMPGILDAAERFRARVADLDIDGLRVTISIGIGVYHGTRGAVDMTTPAALVKAADEALYKAKERGRNQVCFL
ncbi:MAG: diguanylate cyclase [Magnetococcales bacterium]|nr:diguanylate cyclase [Magnetococcales bacterium]